MQRERTTQVDFVTDGLRFASAIGPLVARDRVGATMVSHVLASHLDVPFAEPPLLALVCDVDRVVAAAIRVLPYPMLVVVDPDLDEPATVLDELAGAVVASAEPIGGFSGRRRTVDLLATAWTARTGTPCRPRMRTLFHRLGHFIEPIGVPGAPRPADIQDATDVDLLARWFIDFRRETGLARGPLSPDPDSVRSGAARGEVYTLWSVAGEPVAVAGRAAVRAGRTRIAPVYTPRDQRRHGFGSAVTAAAVHSARSHGATEVTLFTDAEYEPSNRVYQALGFEVVGEFAEFEILGSA